MLGRKKRKQALQQARELEAAKDVDGAVRAYAEAGALVEAGAVLARHARYAEGGQLLLRSLGVEPDKAGMLDADGRKRAQLAASYLAKAGDAETAVTLLVALGDRMRAAELLERSGDVLGAQRLREGGGRRGGMRVQQDRVAAGDPAVNRDRARALEQEGKREVAAQIYVQLKQYGDAGRIFVDLGQLQNAADMFVKGGMPYEAAACYLRLGDAAKGLEHLVRVSRADPRYRKAANEAIRLAGERDSLSFQLEHFVAEFVSAGPTDDAERESFFTLARLYAKQDLAENAREALRMVLACFPDDREARQRLQNIETHGRRSSDVYERIVDQDSGFTGERVPQAKAQEGADEFLPGLPALPELPRLPTIQQDFGSEQRLQQGMPPVHAAPMPPLSAAMQPVQTSQQGAPPLPAPPAGMPVLPNTRMGQISPQQPPMAATPGGDAAAPESYVQTVNPGGHGQGGPVVGLATAAEQVFNSFEVGGVVADRYRLEQKLGQGGTAVVFRAMDLELDEAIALKVYLAQDVDPELDAQSQARFKQELKLNRHLQHRNILRLYDISMFQGRRYISMELLVGRCLDEVLTGRPMPPARALAFLVQACRGLQAAHDRNVIHRDIKPQNLFLTEEDVVKVMDFGIAKHGAGASLTRTGTLAGTPRYMAPEQISAFGSVSAAADQYSLGVVAYEMFTGQVPFDHEELMPLLMLHMNEAPRPMREINPELPAELDAAVLKLLEKDPEARFANCNDLARTLQRLRGQFRVD